MALAVAGAATGMAALPAAASDYKKWGGIYIGATAGWVGTDIDASWPNRNPQSLPGQFSHDDSAAIFTGLIGIQAQLGQFVLGVEANVGGKAFDNNNGFTTGDPGSGCPNPAFTCQARADGLLFTIGPRLGWAFSEHWMAFVTGGFATWNVETRSTNNNTSVDFDGTRARHDGWFVGGGIEYAITRNWTLGVEYQRLDLDNERHISSASGLTDVNTRDVDLTADIVRARLTFKLGRPDERQESMK